MLKQMRAGAKSKLLNLLLFGPLLLAMGGLAIIGGQSNLKDSLKGDTIVSFGHTKVSLSAFDRLVQNAIRQDHLKQADAYRKGLPRDLLQREVDSRVFSMAADDTGIQVDDVTAAKQVKDMIAPLTEKGLSPQEALNRVLQSYNTSEPQLVATIKDQISTNQLIGAVASGITAPAALTADILKFTHEYRRGEYFRLTAANAGTVKQPTDDELKAYYTSLASQYALPEYRTLSVLILDKNSLGDSVKITDDKLQQYYDDNIGDYKTEETRTFSQVVAPDEETAKQVYAAATASKNLEAAGKGKGSYIKPDTLVQSKTAVELAKTVFSGKAGDVLPPVKSPLGWHVVYLEKVTPAETRSFESVKDTIAKDISQDKVSEALYQFANKIDDQIAGGSTVAEVAKENHLAAVTLSHIDAHGIAQDGKKADDKLPIYDKLVATGFSLHKGGASQLIEVPGNAFAIVGADDVFPSEQQPFEKVRAKLLGSWVAAHQRDALQQKAEQIIADLKKGGSFEKAAAAVGQSVQSTSLIKRGTNALEAKLDSNLLNGLFSLESAGQTTSVEDGNVVTIIRLTERKVQPPEGNAAKEATDMQAILSRAMQQDLLEQYRHSLLAKYDVSINEKLLAETYTPKADDAEGAEGLDDGGAN